MDISRDPHPFCITIRGLYSYTSSCNLRQIIPLCAHRATVVESAREIYWTNVSSNIICEGELSKVPVSKPKNQKKNKKQNKQTKTKQKQNKTKKNKQTNKTNKQTNKQIKGTQIVTSYK